MYIRRLAAPLVGATIALAGCGSDDPSDTTASGNTEQSSENGASKPEGPGETEDAPGGLDLKGLGLEGPRLEDLNLEDLKSEALTGLEGLRAEALAGLEDVDPDMLSEEELACYNQSAALLPLTMAPLSIGLQTEDDMSADVHAALDELSSAYPDLQTDLDALGQMVEQSADVDITDPDHLMKNTDYEAALATVERRVNDICESGFSTE